MKKRWPIFAVIFFLLAFAASQAHASQTYAPLPTTGTLTGLQAVTDMNQNFDAVISSLSGTTSTTALSPQLGWPWLDTTNHQMKFYDGSSFIVLYSYDGTGHTITLPIANLSNLPSVGACGDSTHALASTTTGFACQTLSGGGGSLALAASTSNVTYSALMAATTTSSGLTTIYSGASYTYNPSTKIFNLPSGATYEINGTQIALSNLSNGTTGTGTTVVLSAGPTISGTLTLSSSTTGVPETSGTGAVTVQAFGPNGTYFKSLGTTTTWDTPAGSGTVNSGVANALGFYSTGGTAIGGTTTANASINAGAMTLGSTGVAGSLTFGNATSGTVKIQPVTGALSSGTISIPNATDTLVTLAATQTLTNKTLTSPTLTTPALGTPSAVDLSNATNLPTSALPANQKIRAIVYVIDGGGSTITTGVHGDLYVPMACVVTSASLLADQSGSIVVNVWMDTYANYPPTVADKITSSAPPTISSATKAQDNTLTGWTTSIPAGDTLRFNVDSVTTITRVTLTLNCNAS